MGREVKEERLCPQRDRNASSARRFGWDTLACFSSRSLPTDRRGASAGIGGGAPAHINNSVVTSRVSPTAPERHERAGDRTLTVALVIIDALLSAGSRTRLGAR